MWYRFKWTTQIDSHGLKPRWKMEPRTDLEYLTNPEQGLKIVKNKLYLCINTTRGIYAENKLTSTEAIELARQLLNAAYKLT